MTYEHKNIERTAGKRKETRIKLILFENCPKEQLLRGTRNSAGYERKSSEAEILRKNEREGIQNWNWICIVMVFGGTNSFKIRYVLRKRG